MSGGHKAGNMEADLCGVTISVMICGELMVVGVLGGGTIESALEGDLVGSSRKIARFRLAIWHGTSRQGYSYRVRPVLIE